MSFATTNILATTPSQSFSARLLPMLIASLLFAPLTVACGDGDQANLPTGSSSSSGSSGSSNEDGDATAASSADAIDITDVLFTARKGSCADYANSYFSAVMDVQSGNSFHGSLVITVSGYTCTFNANMIPNHNFQEDGAFATPVAEQDVTYEMTTDPAAAAAPTALAMGDNALFLNGVKLDLLAAACYDVGNEPLGDEKIGCGPDQIDNPWRYDPMSPLNQFGTDSNNAHTQPDGTYHYHGNPMAMFDNDCDSSGTPSPVIGFAADGFPIYGPCFDDGDSVRKAESSYLLKEGLRQDVAGYTTPVAGQGAVEGDSYDGQFRGDWAYISGAGDLDACNGMTVDGQYGYYIVDAYPWVLGCFTGTRDSSFVSISAP